MPTMSGDSFTHAITGGSTLNAIRGMQRNFCNCLGISGNAKAIVEM